MKKTIIILILSAILTSCGNFEETAPTVAEETKAVGHTADEAAITTASITAVTQTSTASVTSEVTTKICSPLATETTVEEVSAATANTDIQSKYVTESYQENASEIVTTESKTETVPITTTQMHTTRVANTTAEQPVTTAPTITTTEIYTEPSKMNVTEHWLIYFGDSHNKDYYVNIGKGLDNDGSGSSKAQAVFDYVTANFSNDNACTYMSAVTMCLCEGIGLDCKYALISDWYGHCANAVSVDGIWYVLDTQADGYLCGNFGFTRILDEYENELSIILSENDY